MKNKKTLILGLSIISIILAISVILLITNKKTINYDVVFETEGGTAVKSQTIKEGEQVKKPEEPKKEGYIFVEWTYEGEIYDFSNEVKSNINLVAKWVKIEENIETFVVKFESDGGTTISNQIIKKGDIVKKPEDPVKEGFTFKGWILNNEVYDFETVVNNTIELKAKWEKNKEEQVNNNENNNQHQENNNENNNQEENVIKLITPTIINYEFVGSSEKGNGYSLQLEPVGIISGIEMYSSTTEKGTYTLEKTIKKENISNNQVFVNLFSGEKLYYKVRTYVTTEKGTFYSDYSNIMMVDNSLTTPTIINYEFVGSSEKGNGYALQLEPVGIISGIEMYSSTTEKGTYTLEKTIKKENISNNQVFVNLFSGEKLYYKVRTYVTTEKGTFYSDYSNIMMVDNSLTN